MHAPTLTLTLKKKSQARPVSGPRLLSLRSTERRRPEPVERALFQFGLFTLTALVSYFILFSDKADGDRLMLGLVILVLPALPALRWAYTGARSLPLIETFMLTTVNTYALPLLTGHQSLDLYSDDTIHLAAWTVIAFQIACMVGDVCVSVAPSDSSFWRTEIMPARWHHVVLPQALALAVAHVVFTRLFGDIYNTLVPPELVSVLRAVAYGIITACTFVLCRQWALGRLAPAARICVGTLIAIHVTVECSSLYLIDGISMLVLVSLACVSAGRRPPLILVGSSIMIFSVLHNGKAAMREIYWRSDAEPSITLATLPSFYAEWIDHGLRTGPLSEQHMSAKLLERTSLFHILCLVVDRTPQSLDYLNGKTYEPIPTQLIPRFVWPEKPEAHIATSRLGIYYGIQTEESTSKTTIAFGILSEAYANFGLIGVMSLGAAFGAIFKLLRCRSRCAASLSYGGLVLMLMTAWSFQTELTLAIWLSSLFQGFIAVLGLPLCIRTFLNIR